MEVRARKASAARWPSFSPLGYFGSGGETASDAWEVPRLYVNLDLEPELRWANVTRYYKDIGAYPAHFLRDFPLGNSEAQWAVIRELKSRMDEEYLREMAGIAADVDHPNATIDKILAGNLRYELTGDPVGEAGIQASLAGMDWQRFFGPAEGCSGLLAAMPNGTVVHGRNMDWGNYQVTTPDGRTLHWPQVTTEVIFLRAGKPLFVSTHWPGLVGIHTGMRFDGWSFEQNLRKHGPETAALNGLLQGSEGYMFRARRIMESTPDFEAAVQELYNSNVMAPMYFIVAGTGPYEGAVLTLDAGGKHKESTPPITRLSSSMPAIKDGKSYKGWHIIQTNDDQDTMPLDERRPLEEAKLLVSAQREVGTPWMFSQLLAPPLFQQSTVFTSVYVPASGFHRTLAHLNHVG